LPTVDEVPAGFPADLLWQFRMSSLAVQFTLWAVLGIALASMIGVVTDRTAQAARPLTGAAA
jgi:predicted cobalt transporter CbtA